MSCSEENSDKYGFSLDSKSIPFFLGRGSGGVYGSLTQCHHDMKPLKPPCTIPNNTLADSQNIFKLGCFIH